MLSPRPLISYLTLNARTVALESLSARSPSRSHVRFAPSPTGFLHTGGVYTANLGKNLAHHSGGSYFIRIEDTDQAREVPGSREQFVRGFKYFDIESDENDSNSKWGPYEQSKRERIYHTYARELLRDHAYLCFCTS
jgi:glutamyl-tRNA synthetase